MDMERLTRYGFATGAVAALAAVTALLYGQLNQPVREIKVEGPLSPTERALLQAALVPYSDARILTADLDALVGAVEALGWPQEVTVRRRWPDQLLLAIRKQSVVAHWQDSAFLTSTGRVIGQADVQGTLPRLAVEDVDPLVALETLQQLDALARGQRLRVSALDFDAADGWRVTQSDGLPVYLGLGSLQTVLLPRYQRFLRVRAQIVARHGSALRYADARYDSGVAIRAEGEEEPLLLGQAISKERGPHGR